jgi:hypothetical protein
MERVLLPSKTRTQFFVRLCSLLFFVLCVCAVAKGGLRGLRTVGWPLFCIAAGIAIYAMRLYPSVVYLKLTDRGFEYKNYLPARFIEWKDVRHFTTYRNRGWLYVGWIYSQRYFGTKMPFPKMMGIEGYFRENFDHKPRDLVRLLEEWRKKHSGE